MRYELARHVTGLRFCVISAPQLSQNRLVPTYDLRLTYCSFVFSVHSSCHFARSSISMHAGSFFRDGVNRKIVSFNANLVDRCNLSTFNYTAENVLLNRTFGSARRNSGFLRHRSAEPVESRETLMPAETRAGDGIVLRLVLKLRATRTRETSFHSLVID